MSAEDWSVAIYGLCYIVTHISYRSEKKKKKITEWHQIDEPTLKMHYFGSGLLSN